MYVTEFLYSFCPGKYKFGWVFVPRVLNDMLLTNDEYPDQRDDYNPNQPLSSTPHSSDRWRISPPAGLLESLTHSLTLI